MVGDGWTAREDRDGKVLLRRKPARSYGSEFGSDVAEGPSLYRRSRPPQRSSGIIAILGRTEAAGDIFHVCYRSSISKDGPSWL